MEMANLAAQGLHPDVLCGGTKLAHRQTAFVALGSNLGDRESRLRAGREALAALAATDVVGASSLYETIPVGPVAQGPYLNAVVALETDFSARALLDQMLLIEASQGRRRDAQAERFGSSGSSQPGSSVV